MNQNRKRVFLAGSTLLILLAIFVVGVGLMAGFFLLNARAGEAKRIIRVRPIAPLQLDTAVTPVANANLLAEQLATPYPVSSPGAQAVHQTEPSNSTTGIAGGPAWSGQAQTVSTEPTAPNSAVTVSSFANSPLPTPTVAPSFALTPTLTPMPTVTPTVTVPGVGPGRITGRVHLDGEPVSSGIILQLENSQTFELVAETTIGSNGLYSFENIPALATGYNVLFDQEANPQYDLEQVISWGWLGPIVVAENATVNLPELEIALLGFEPISPEPNAIFTAEMPITFRWSAYPQAAKYWVDLVRGENMESVWQSAPLQATSVTFAGKAAGGGLEAGEYWWGVGAQRSVGNYTLTVYGYLPVLLIQTE